MTDAQAGGGGQGDQGSAKAQFNVYLPRELIRRAKYASVDTGQSLSRLVEEALTAYLDQMNTQQ